ncbi:MAG TPA: ASKHA domain-containing protein [Candidatus Limiplasma sp.]|nr:ASKHA domain-containing protein [Candidatus Limiplasma sp.]
MAKLTIRQGDRRSTLTFDGETPLTALLRRHGQTIATPCGGKGTCGKCRVSATGNLSCLTENENKTLTPDEIARGIRLACQVTVSGDAEVTVPQQADLMNVQLEGDIPDFVYQPMQGPYGLAVDIGTTTLALRLLDLKRHTLLKAATASNPQGEVAADVIGRIEAALHGEGYRLQRLVTDAIEQALIKLCADSAISPNEIGSIVIAGNTTMLYLLTGRDPVTLSRAPFEADTLFDAWVDGKALRLLSAANTGVYLPACMSAFVGADIVCGVLACGMCDRETTSLLVDLGTNGEIALWHERKLYCCATAAGPAFEGVNIRHGVGSVPGAIDRVWVQDGNLSYTTLGGQAPVGICGSGLIDAVAALRELSLVDETGLMETGEERIGGEIGLTQKDIRSIQLAKGAIAAGIKTLCAYVGISAEQIKTLYIAGGFGSHVSVGKAAAIGLIPLELKDRALVLGNASLTGAEMLLFNEDFVKAARNIAQKAVSVPLGGSAAFAEYYMESMMFE